MIYCNPICIQFPKDYLSGNILVAGVILMKITVWAILFWRASAYNTCVGQTIIGLSALTEIATFAYNLLKGHILYNKNVIYDFEQNYFLLVLLPLLHTSCLQVTSLIF